MSELVTNALRHALPDSGVAPRRSLIRLGLLQPGPCVLCAVADPSGAVPVMSQADVLAETGRGLHVVGGLADLWGYTAPGETGKVVWAMFSLPAHPTAPARTPPANYARQQDRLTVTNP